MTTEIISQILLVCVIIYQAYEKHLLNKYSMEREKELLDRIMARNYETFVHGEVLRKPEQPLTPEEIYERDHERGIPVLTRRGRLRTKSLIPLFHSWKIIFPMMKHG